MAAGTTARVASGLERGAIGPRSPLKAIVSGFDARPVPTFAEAIAAVADSGVIPDLEAFAEITYQSATDAKTFGDLTGDALDIDSIACLMKYSDEDTDPPIYMDMNTKCYNRNRTFVRVYAQFLWLLVKALQLIEPYPLQQGFRGVKQDLRSEYPVGREFTWQSPSSCTKTIEVLSNPMFCGESGPRTIFVIRLTQNQAREITRYSLIAEEDEILLPPGSRFKVESVLPQGDLTIIQIVEIPSKEWLLDISPSSLPAVIGVAGVASAPGCGGEPELLLWHGTTLAAAMDIQRQGFRTSQSGIFGPGVYLTSGKDKAEAWARFAASPIVRFVHDVGMMNDQRCFLEAGRPRRDSPQSTPVIVQVRVFARRPCLVNFDSDKQVALYEGYHNTAISQCKYDELGRISLDFTEFPAGVKGWIEKGFDSLHVQNTGKLMTKVSGRRQFDAEIDRRWLGDEWVLSDAEMAQYVCHTDVPFDEALEFKVDFRHLPH